MGTLRQGLIFCCAGLLALVSLATDGLAGAWVQPEGRTQIIFSSSISEARQRFSRGSPDLRTERFSKQETIVSAERGLGKNTALLVRLQLQHIGLVSFLDQKHAIHGAVAFGLKTNLWAQDGWILSAQATAHVGTERRFPRQTGPMSAPAEGEIRVNLGHGFLVLNRSAFVDVQTAYRWRGGGMGDEVKVDATIGVRPLPHVLVLLQAFNTIAITKNNQADSKRFRQHKVQASLVYDFGERWSVQFGIFSAVAGQNAVKERGGLAAVWWKF
jgi:protein XagA